MSHTWYLTFITVPNLLICFIRILRYCIISWWFILFYLVVIVGNPGCAYSIDVDMSVWHIDECFLICIISSRYQSHESIYWARITGLSYLLDASSLFMCACAHDTVFNACSFIRIYRYTCLSLHATWHSQHHSLGSSDSPGSSCPGFKAWSLWILPVTIQSGAAKAWIIKRPSEALSFQAPFLGSRVFLLWILALICTVYNCISLCILAFTLIRWCNILVILCHICDNFVIVLIC